MRVLLLPLGGGAWCVPLDVVREVLVTPRTTPLPTARPGVVGVFNLRGSVLPLFGTAELLGLPPAPAAHTVVLEVAGALAGLEAAGQPRAVRLGPLVGAPEHPAALGTYAVEGADGTDDDVAVLLAVERLLA